MAAEEAEEEVIHYRVLRDSAKRDGILGYFYRMDEMVCFTLEPPKMDKDGAIPAGVYGLSWEKSPKLGIFTPRLLGVLNRRGILIHAGNSIQDTEGCILVGSKWHETTDGELWLSQSRAARDRVYMMIEGDLSGGYADIEVCD